MSKFCVLLFYFRIMRILMFILFVICFSSISAQNKTDKYIERYSQIAIDEMNKYNIPASITLAQGILESGNGESYLALEGNNHFGIKCHENWYGEVIMQDDDEEDECFRKYLKPVDSFRDHSVFLAERDRYSFLFKYKRSNYKKWAKGLKEAGYATNPEYPKLLINLIEKYDLSRFDNSRVKSRNFYFAHSYGFPYLIGVGAYYFTQESIFCSAVNTSFLFSESNLGYYYKIGGTLYFGLNSGIIYLPADEKDIIPQVSVKLLYKNNSFIISTGMQFPLNEMLYKQIPFLELTYLLDRFDNS